MRLKNRKRKEIQSRNETKKQLEKRDYALVARQAESSFPDLICFGEFIKIVECKTGKIRKSDVKKMKNLIKEIIKKQPLLGNIIWGEIRSREKTVWLCPETQCIIKTRQLLLKDR